MPQINDPGIFYMEVIMFKKSITVSLCLISMAAGQNVIAMARMKSFFNFSSTKPQTHAFEISSFEKIKKERFALPKMPDHKIDPSLVKKHHALCKKWFSCDQNFKETLKIVTATHTIMLGTAPLALSLTNIEAVSDLMLMMATGPGFVGLAGSCVTIPAALISMNRRKNRLSKIESEIDVIAKEYKRELTLRDDIQ